jgi:hypothetical protein
MITAYALFCVVSAHLQCFSYATKRLFLLISDILRVIIGLSAIKLRNKSIN